MRVNSQHARTGVFKFWSNRILDTAKAALYPSKNPYKMPAVRLPKRHSNSTVRAAPYKYTSGRKKPDKYKALAGGQGLKGNEIGATTYQHDASLVYLKKRKKRKDRKKRKFANKVKYAIQNMLGDQVLTRSLIGAASSSAGLQFVVDYSMWGAGDLGSQNHDDINTCFMGYQNGIATPNSYIIQQSCNFEWTVTNATIGAQNTAILKVVYCYAKVDTNQTPQELWNNMNAHQGPLPNNAAMEGTVGVPTIGTVQSLPFTSPEFCRVFTIGEVRKYQIPAGNSVTWRDVDIRRKKRLSSDYFQAKFKKGTKFIMLVWHGIGIVPVGEINKSNMYPPVRMTIGIQKTYKFNVLKDNYNQAGSSDNTV